VTRQYDSEGNEVIIVDYFRKPEDIRAYRQRKGFEVEASETAMCVSVCVIRRRECLLSVVCVLPQCFQTVGERQEASRGNHGATAPLGARRWAC
jgi:hypothetical protein